MFFEIVWAILGPLHFHLNSKTSLSISEKKKEKKRKLAGILMVSDLNVYNLDSTVTLVCLLIYEYWKSFHLIFS